ncbi:hypothetical protein [Paenibacillus sp. NPDC058177]|uniref:hypothetical protein n=1 Tax=Paenibacillus sp. NPDC058177 TaxID=3346369 RepID=UPI0036DCA1A0
MKNFYIVSDDNQEIINFYTLSNCGQIVVKAIDLMLFSGIVSKRNFRKNMFKLPSHPNCIMPFQVFLPYKSKLHVARWFLDSPISTLEHEACLELYSRKDQQCNELKGLFETDRPTIRLVAYNKEDTLMAKPFYLLLKSCGYPLWSSEEATMDAKIDSYMDIEISSLPTHIQPIFIQIIKDDLMNQTHQPCSIKEYGDYLEVQWKLDRYLTNEFLDTMYWRF